jgi:molybdate transport system permease protein
MARRSREFLQSFDYWLAVPLAFYVLLIAVLVGAVVGSVTPASVTRAFRESEVLFAVWLSLLTSCLSASLAVFVAIPAGYVLSRRKFPGRAVADMLLDLPIMLPPLVLGLSVLIFFNTPLGRLFDRSVGFVYTWRGIVLVQFVAGCAYAVRVVKAGFDQTPVDYEQVAMVLGANRARAFVHVSLPIIRRAVVAGAVITWAHIFGLFGPIILVAGTMRRRTEIMPTTIYLEASVGRIEIALVIGAAMMLISMVTLMLVKRLGAEDQT